MSMKILNQIKELLALAKIMDNALDLSDSDIEKISYNNKTKVKQWYMEEIANRYAALFERDTKH